MGCKFQHYKIPIRSALTLFIFSQTVVQLRRVDAQILGNCATPLLIVREGENNWLSEEEAPKRSIEEGDLV
jgi:hypothetical protein